MRGVDGEVIRWFGTNTDIEERRVAEDRQSFLAEAGWVLGSSLDYQQTLTDVARLAVPRIADWCAVDVFVGDRLKRLALEHVDPLKIALARELAGPMLSAQQPPAGATAVRLQEPVLVRAIDDAALATFGFDERQLEIARSLAPRSYVTVPLVARGEVFGAISLVTAESGRAYGDDDLALAVDLAHHAAAAIDTARSTTRRGAGRAARVLEAVGDGVVLVDRDGVIRLWNTAAATITGVPEEDVLGKEIEDVVQGWQEIAPLIPVASKPGEPVRAETIPVEFGGRELWISGSGVGFEEGTVYAFRDLTEERALEEMKAEFVATVSHELRTPLAAIYGSAQTIRRTDIELDPEIRDQLLGVIASESTGSGRSSTTSSSPGASTRVSYPSRSRAAIPSSWRMEWSSRPGPICPRSSSSSCARRNGSPTSSPTRASSGRCWSTSSTTRSSTPPRAASSRSRSRTATARSASPSRTAASASRRRSTAASSRSSIASIPI